MIIELKYFLLLETPCLYNLYVTDVLTCKIQTLSGGVWGKQLPLFVKQEVEQEFNRVTRGSSKLLITALVTGHTALSAFFFPETSTLGETFSVCESR